MTQIIYVGTDCVECGRGPMLSRWGNRDKHGVKHGARGMCQSCLTKAIYRQKHPNARTYGQPGDAIRNYERNLAGLQSYLDSRRRRGIPADGSGYIRLAGKSAA